MDWLSLALPRGPLPDPHKAFRLLLSRAGHTIRDHRVDRTSLHYL